MGHLPHGLEREKVKVNTKSCSQLKTFLDFSIPNLFSVVTGSCNYAPSHNCHNCQVAIDPFSLKCLDLDLQWTVISAQTRSSQAR